MRTAARRRPCGRCGTVARAKLTRTIPMRCNPLAHAASQPAQRGRGAAMPAQSAACRRPRLHTLDRPSRCGRRRAWGSRGLVGLPASGPARGWAARSRERDVGAGSSTHAQRDDAALAAGDQTVLRRDVPRQWLFTDDVRIRFESWFISPLFDPTNVCGTRHGRPPLVVAT